MYSIFRWSYLVLAGCWLVLLPPETVRAQGFIQGIVFDAESGRPLPRAHVFIEGTGTGTIANEEGRFEIRIGGFPATLVFQFIGYKTVRITFNRMETEPQIIRLERAVVDLGEVVITGDDFAENVMRKVIERKKRLFSGIRTYTAEGYTKLVLENRGEIVLLSESVFDMYWDRNRGPREVIRSRRETGDFYHELPVQESGMAASFYEDEIDMNGLRMIGPTHPDALTYYTFELAERKKLDNRFVYELYVIPRDRSHPTFIGMVSILEGEYVLLRAELRPARHVVFPLPTVDWNVTYEQKFGQVGDSLWLPLDLNLSGMLRTRIDLLNEQTIGIKRVSLFTRYQPGVELPVEPYATSSRVIVDSVSVWEDDLFLRGRGILPLTERESHALAALKDRPTSLREALPPVRRDGWVAAFLRWNESGDQIRLTWPEIYGYRLRFRYNRVDGVYSSVSQLFDRGPHKQLEWYLAQASRLDRIRGLIRLSYPVGDKTFVEGSYGGDIKPWPIGSLYPAAASSVPAFLTGDDYFNYYWYRGWTLRGGWDNGQAALIGAIHIEKHSSVHLDSTRSLLFRNEMLPNPAIEGGRYHSLSVSALIRSKPGLTSERRAVLDVEYSPGSRVGSDFSFVKAVLDVSATIPTFYRGRTLPNTLGLQVRTGAATAGLPMQRSMALDGALMQYGTRGVFRSQPDRPLMARDFATVFWEHRFRTVPFEWLRMWPLVRTGTGLSLFGASGSGTSVEGGLFQGQSFSRGEVGLSITNLLGSFLNMHAGRRLDRPGWFWGFSIDSRKILY